MEVLRDDTLRLRSGQAPAVPYKQGHAFADPQPLPMTEADQEDAVAQMWLHRLLAIGRQVLGTDTLSSILMRDSAGIPKPLCRRQIIFRLSGRLRFNTS